jgi:tRNA pseudouridine38-40 synthase
METERNIRLLIEYDGTRYLGWQVQPHGTTIQQELEAAILRITGERACVIAAGRTDAGVHASGQVAHFHTTSPIPPEKMQRALNAVLPGDIAVLRVEDADVGFHARFRAKSKRYRYTILNRPFRSPLNRTAALLVPQPLDIEAMRAAARHCIGTHDFSSFGCNAGRDDNPVRTVLDFAVESQGAYVVIEIEAVSFMYKMVRSLVGTLLDVGKGKITPDEVLRIMSARDRRAACPTAPAHGLCLIKVNY